MKGKTKGREFFSWLGLFTYYVTQGDEECQTKRDEQRFVMEYKIYRMKRDKEVGGSYELSILAQ